MQLFTQQIYYMNGGVLIEKSGIANQNSAIPL